MRHSRITLAGGRIASVGLFLLVAGCVTMPKQTQELNTLLGNQIAESKRMNLEIIDGWAEQSRGRVKTLLHYHLVPQLIIKFLNDPDVKSDFSKIVCGKDGGIMDRAFVVRDMVEAISFEVEKLNTKLLGAVESQRASLVAAANLHYMDMERMHRAIQANINSVVRGHQFEKQIREALSRPIKEVVPLEKAQKALDKTLDSLLEPYTETNKAE
jgi:hypothetical protein